MGMQSSIQNNKFGIIGNPPIVWKIYIDKGNFIFLAALAKIAIPGM